MESAIGGTGLRQSRAASYPLEELAKREIGVSKAPQKPRARQDPLDLSEDHGAASETSRRRRLGVGSQRGFPARPLELRYRLERGWRPLLDRLADLGFRGALVGPHGSGKTTLLEDLEERLAADGWRIVPLRLSRERRRLDREDWRRVEGAASSA